MDRTTVVHKSTILSGVKATFLQQFTGVLEFTAANVMLGPEKKFE